MTLADLAIVALGLLFIWMLGGLLLRLSGLALALLEGRSTLIRESDSD